ncbi:T9SS type A sorting domain-containing protein [Flammeovirga sp. EKP202]|uniref:T9SS type A sorting domain-containing protein n=1 Tax=Flammeovirga sp. EKP202 TaxID=2770592 RepID=UPI00165F6820|nr:T9SS type A sorting domain-containing protein [Flammeovirga sp. EKP202]MBD0401568.1 T9SS type A sorting domain-containing protein [Flammeovirga sp. EKP202]
MKRYYQPICKVLACVSVMLYTQESFAQTAVSVDFQTQRYLEDVSELDRKKYFNMHMVANKDLNDEDMEVINNWGLTQGRSFWGAFGRYKDYISKNNVFPIASQVEKEGINNINYTKQQDYYKHISRQLVVTDHPAAMIRMEMNTEEAGQFAAQYFKHFYEDATRPMYYEPVNEPFVHADEYQENGKYTEAEVRRKTAEYFKEIGKAFDEQGVDTKVIGYSSAWPSMELWDFEHWQTRMKMFMDVAGDYMDGFSTHLYDGINVTGQDTERSGSNADAILDLIETYSYIKWNEIKPHAITEYGGISKGFGDTYTDIESIQTVRSINHMIFGLMDREDRLMISIPFITGKSPWHWGSNFEPYGADLWRPVKSSVVNGVPTEFELTAKKDFFNLWDNVQGKRVRCSSSNPDVFVQAFVDGKTAYICLNNIDTENQDVALQFVSSMGNFQNVNKRSLKIYQNENPIYNDEDLTEIPSSITIEPHETVVLTYTLDREVTFSQKAVRKEYYSKTYMQEIEANNTMEFDFNDVNELSTEGEARLRMAIGRKHEMSKKPMVKINGVKINALENWKGYDQADREDFFGVIEVPIPYQLLKANNTVELKFSDEGGTVSSVVLSVNSIHTLGNRFPFNGSNYQLPQKIEAEDFDIGGQGIGYFSLDDINNSKQYRLSEGVNIQKNDSNFDIILEEGEWTSYSIDVPENATYTLSLSGKSTTDNAKVSITSNNEALGEIITLNNVDQTISETTLELPAGQYPIQMLSEMGTSVIDFIEINNGQTLSEAISFTSNNTEIKMGEVNTFDLTYTTSDDRDIIVELWGDAFLLGQAKVNVAKGTGNISVDLNVFAEPLNYENVEVVAKVLKSNTYTSLAEAIMTEFEFNPILSIGDDLNNEENITIFPNPTTNQQLMGIKGNSKIYKIEVMDTKGKLFDQFDYPVPNTQVNFKLTDHYSKGIYLIRVYGEKENFIKKILIQ